MLPGELAISKDRKLFFVGSSKDKTIVTYDTVTMTPAGKVTVNRPMGIEIR